MSYNNLTLDQWRALNFIKAWMKACMERGVEWSNWFDRAEQVGLLEHVELRSVDDD